MMEIRARLENIGNYPTELTAHKIASEIEKAICKHLQTIEINLPTDVVVYVNIDTNAL
jgi:hypothetical protein